MLFLGGDHHSEAEFIRNIGLVSNRSLSHHAEGCASNSSRDVPKRILSCLLHDLSFWDASSSQFDLHDSKLPRGRTRQQCPSSTASTTSTSISSVGSRNTARHHERMQRQSSGNCSTSDSHTGAIWKTAIDPLSGRTYYYDAITRRTQWHKVRRLFFKESFRI